MVSLAYPNPHPHINPSVVGENDDAAEADMAEEAHEAVEADEAEVGQHKSKKKDACEENMKHKDAPLWLTIAGTTPPC